MGEFRPWNEVLMEFLADPSDRIVYLDVTLEEYHKDGDILFFLKEIGNVVQAQGGIAKAAENAAMSPETLSKILASEEAPKLDVFIDILKGLGYRLCVKAITDEELKS